MPAEFLFANARSINAPALDMGEPNPPRISRGGIIFSPRMMSVPKLPSDGGGTENGSGDCQGECACGWVN